MKATFDVPDELYRRVKAKSALEGRPVREVTAELFRRYVAEPAPAGDVAEAAATASAVVADQKLPSWFGVLRKYARRVDRHDLEAIRDSIGRGIASERSR